MGRESSLWETDEKCTHFQLASLSGRDLSVDGRILLKQTLRKQGVITRTGFIWLRTETSGIALVNKATNLLVSYKAWNFQLSDY
jgi:hypothetical protein